MRIIIFIIIAFQYKTAFKKTRAKNRPKIVLRFASVGRSPMDRCTYAGDGCGGICECDIIIVYRYSHNIVVHNYSPNILFNMFCLHSNTATDRSKCTTYIQVPTAAAVQHLQRGGRRRQFFLWSLACKRSIIGTGIILYYK